ncbi:hypothetical protein BX281_8395 [Streptomyces sp. Ag82_O1-15]|nr:hypothetical protein BX281_8395 [Streptomyces sp. Ag82_O1-15]
MPRRNHNVDRTRDHKSPEWLSKRDARRLATKSRRRRWSA